MLKEKGKNRKKNFKILENILGNKSRDLYRFRSITFQIDKEDFLFGLRKIFEKINSYEQDKLESKNIYNDYVRLTTDYKVFCINKNFNFNLTIEPRLIYDTIFYSCKIRFNYIENPFEFNGGFKTHELKNAKSEA